MFNIILSHCKDFATQRQLLLLEDDLIYSRENDKLCVFDYIVFETKFNLYRYGYDCITEKIAYGNKSLGINYDDCEIYFIFYEKDIIQRKICYYYCNGQKESDYSYINGKLHGRFVEYHENGVIKTIIHYKDDKKHGEFIYYYENGNKNSECNFVNGKIHGKEITYDINGNKKLERHYVDGIRIRLIRYDKNGNIIEQINLD